MRIYHEDHNGREDVELAEEPSLWEEARRSFPKEGSRRDGTALPEQGAVQISPSKYIHPLVIASPAPAGLTLASGCFAGYIAPPGTRCCPEDF